MKKYAIGSIPLVIALALTVLGCNNPVERKPVLSIADLMIDKVTHSTDSSANATVIKLKNLRSYDSLFYKALFVGSDTLPNLYFYSRRGSCCPCTSGGQSCCQCSSGSAFGIPEQAMSQPVGLRKIDKGSVFMLAKMSAAPPTNTLNLESRVIDGMLIYTVPLNTPPGTYQAPIKGGSIDLTLQIAIDSNHNIDILDIQ